MSDRYRQRERSPPRSHHKRSRSASPNDGNKRYRNNNNNNSGGYQYSSRVGEAIKLGFEQMDAAKEEKQAKILGDTVIKCLGPITGVGNFQHAIPGPHHPAANIMPPAQQAQQQPQQLQHILQPMQPPFNQQFYPSYGNYPLVPPVPPPPEPKEPDNITGFSEEIRRTLARTSASVDSLAQSVATLAANQTSILALPAPAPAPTPTPTLTPAQKHAADKAMKTLADSFKNTPGGRTSFAQVFAHAGITIPTDAAGEIDKPAALALLAQLLAANSSA